MSKRSKTTVWFYQLADHLGLELRSAARSLRRSPGFLVASVVMLAFGLGLTAFSFGTLNGFFLSDMPFESPDELIEVAYLDPEDAGNVQGVPARQFLLMQQMSLPFDNIAAAGSATMNLSGGNDGTVRPERYAGSFVTGQLFDVIGVQAALGRTIQPGDDVPGKTPAVVISHSLWKNRYQSDPGVIGQEIRVNLEPAIIVGVMPEKFAFPFDEQVWLPMQLDAAEEEGWITADIDVFARLQDGVSLEQAKAAWRTASVNTQDQLPEGYEEFLPYVRQLRDRYISPQSRIMVPAISFFTFLIMLIAVANVANLMIARSVRRQREVAIRSAMGATRQRIIFSTMLEAMLVSALAAGFGWLIANMMSSQIVRMLTEGDDMPVYWITFAPELRTFLFLCGMSLFAALLASWLPARRSVSQDIPGDLKDGTRGSSASVSRLARLLVVGEVAMSFVLLFSFGLFFSSVMNIENKEIGATIENTITGRIALFEEKYPEADARRAFVRRLKSRLEEIPAAESAVVATMLPVAYPGWAPVVTADNPEPPDGRMPFSQDAVVSDGYFDMFEIPLLEGRYLDSRDDANSEPRVVVNQEFVREILGGGQAIGRRILIGGNTEQPVVIVGVVGNVVNDAYDIDEPPHPAMYRHAEQVDRSFFSFAVKVRGNPESQFNAVRAAVQELDADMPIYWLRTLERWLELGMFTHRFTVGLVGFFAIFALLLAMAGIYAVLAYGVAQRTREIGVRRALGASAQRVLALIARQNGLQLLVGLLIGGAFAVFFARIFTGLLVGLDPFHLPTFIGVTLAIAFAVALAAIVPTWRALRVQPQEALRHE